MGYIDSCKLQKILTAHMVILFKKKLNPLKQVSAIKRGHLSEVFCLVARWVKRCNNKGWMGLDLNN